jgi:molecular chaperone GrpE
LTLQDQYLRSVAEFRNLQAQTRRDVLTTQASTIQRFSIELLDTIDALSKALDSNLPRPPLDGSDPNQREDILVTEHRALHDGVRMIERILLNTLEKHGIAAIPTEEEPLSGSHEVVKEVDGEATDVGKIAAIVRQGYRLNGKVIRPVQVLPC